MKKTVILSLALSMGSGIAVVLANDLPQRKSGLWEISVEQDGVPAVTMKQCVDSATDAKMQQSGSEMVEKMGGKCSKNSMEKVSGGYKGEAVCEFSGSKMVATTNLKGDFDNGYSGEVTTKYDPPFMGQSTTTMKMTGKYLGACTDGLVPGDMVMANGMKMNIDSLSKMPIPGAAPKNTGELNKLHQDILKQLENK